MCGRYTLFTEKEQRELYNIIQRVDLKLHGQTMPEATLATGEIHPTNLVPVLRLETQGITPTAAVWGFPHFQGKGVIINARAETAAQKRLFAKPLAAMRCVVPSAGFYEWDKEKNKYLFRQSGNELLYMAGIMDMFQAQLRFVILTTDANDSIKEVHNRMPVILEADEIKSYLSDYHFALSILSRVPVALTKTEESKYENYQLHF